MAPRLVCLSWSDGTRSELLDRQDGIDFVRKALADHTVTLVGQNIPYDMAVIARQAPDLIYPIFKAYDQGRIYDTKINQQLMDIATGEFEFFDYKAPAHRTDLPAVQRMRNKFSLEQLVLRYKNYKLQKGADTWRTRYAELEGWAVDDYPQEAYNYAIGDAKETWDINKMQLEAAGAEIPTRELQTKVDFALHLMSIWGVRTNKQRTLALKERLTQERDEAIKRLKELGFIRKDGTRDLKTIRAAVVEAYSKAGKPVPVSEKDNIVTDKRSFIESGDLDLQLISKYVSVDKQIGTFLPILLQATDVPFNPRWNVLVRSGRTSCGAEDAVGNLQNLRRAGDERSCFEPRQGFYYCSTDLDTAELRSWAECCVDLVGYSRMAEDIKANYDPHLALGADLLNITYEQALEHKKDKDVREARQFAKIPNFGCPGGLQPKTLIEYAKGYEVDLSLEKAEWLYNKWETRYAEARPYFAFIKSLVGGYGNTATYQHHITKFVRGDMMYTELANFLFQHLTATSAKDSIWALSTECYTGESLDGQFTTRKTSPLFGSRPVLFIHDENVLEIPIERASEAAHRQAEVTAKTVQKYYKHVPITCSPALMTRWDKNADPKYENGKLIPWI